MEAEHISWQYDYDFWEEYTIYLSSLGNIVWTHNSLSTKISSTSIPRIDPGIDYKIAFSLMDDV